MNFEQAMNFTYTGTGAMVTRSAFSDQVYIMRDLRVGGENPPLYLNNEEGTKLYVPSPEDKSATDWKEFNFPWNQ